MLEKEDRNCECLNMKDLTIDIPTYSFEFENIKNDEPSCCEKNETKNEILQKIRYLDFAVVELSEYLDTHPMDKKAIKLHNEYANELEILRETFEKTFGPLSIKCPCNKWRWIENPWPWERGNN